MRKYFTGQNVIFTFCVLATFAAMGLNLLAMNAVRVTFDSLYNEAAKAQQIMIAQDYAMTSATIAEYEAGRAHELEEKLEVTVQQYVEVLKANQNLAFTAEMNSISIKAQGAYIEQLREYIEAHKLPVPAPDMNRAFESPVEPPPSGCDKNGCPVNPKEAAPVLEIDLDDNE